MAKADIINVLYSKNKSPLEFRFDSLTCRPLNSLLLQSDIDALYKIATSLRYNANIDLKYAAIDKIMAPRGFKKFASGTNRVVYRYLEDDSFVVKIALDRVGLGDNPAEFKNQSLLQPFITKVFEVDPTGVIATFERVMPVMSKEEMISVHEDVFNMITNCIIGKYVLSDIGAKYFKNIGIRRGFGVVLLDFPYVYELDGKKLYCNKTLDDGHRCGGEIDYDDGFNELICSRCGKKYLAIELAKNDNNNIIIKGDDDMNVKIMKGNKVVKNITKTNEDDFIKVPTTASVDVQEKPAKVFKASLEMNVDQPVQRGEEFNTRITTKKVRVKSKKNNKNSSKPVEKKNFDKKPYKQGYNVEPKVEKEQVEEAPKATKPFVAKDFDKPDFEAIHKKHLDGNSMASLYRDYANSESESGLPKCGKTKFNELYKEYLKTLDHEEPTSEVSVEDENINNVLEAYGLSEEDFDEPEDSYEDEEEEDPYAEYEEKFKDKQSFEKRTKKRRLENF